VLLLDEPTTGLDPHQIIQMRSLIKTMSKEKTIIISTHIMHEVQELCSKVVVLDNGTVIASESPANICNKTKTTSFEKAFIKLTSEAKNER
ncbi:MAG TPA: ABC transporter ATP-binding protein, partial [Treponemataceae bacterium]|nr:ABC transporter ATP-binding protein [Treponemataceae bacterium]